MFGVSTNPERFGHIVSLIANKALKEIYFCFETPKYGKAASVPEYAPASARNSKSNWYIKWGLDTLLPRADISVTSAFPLPFQSGH